jgi:hypothetical protein
MLVSSIPTPYDQQSYDQQHTPGAASASGSVHTADSADKDPFFSLLEQLAENEANGGGRGSDLDYFLQGGGV